MPHNFEGNRNNNNGNDDNAPLNDDPVTQTRRRIIEALENEERNEGNENPLSPEEIRAAVDAYIENLKSRGVEISTIDSHALPFEEMLAARRKMRETGVPIVDPTTGAVLRAEKPEEVRKTIEDYSEGRREGN